MREDVHVDAGFVHFGQPQLAEVEEPLANLGRPAFGSTMNVPYRPRAMCSARGPTWQW